MTHGTQLVAKRARLHRVGEGCQKVLPVKQEHLRNAFGLARAQEARMLPGLQRLKSSRTAAQMKCRQIEYQVGLALRKSLWHARQPSPHRAVERRRPQYEQRVTDPLQRRAVIRQIQDQRLPRKSTRKACQPYT
ncbi:hypothetical protein WKW77_02660 [Variovorax ureilyticus]|uniref:Uncharacterized protein n=1 Tax=Variovorax ureilyticus TaxID=1836198 RepID=A0ABU8V8H7_9BURK